MTTSVPNFNFLATLVLKYGEGFQNKKKLGAADLFKRPLADIFYIKS